jgi:hypothetical protein
MPFRVVEVDGQLIEKPSRVLVKGVNLLTPKLTETTIVTLNGATEYNITELVLTADVPAKWRVYIDSVFQFELGPDNKGKSYNFNGLNKLSTEILDIKVFFNANRTTGICRAAILGYPV